MEGAKRISLILAIVITTITTLVLLLFSFVEQHNIIIAAIVILVITYVILYFTLNSLIYSGLKEIEAILIQSRESGVEQINISRNRFRIKTIRNLITQIVKHLYRNQKKTDELEKVAAFRKGFIADVSHELKTPIFAAQGFVYTLLDGAVEDKEVRTRFLEKAAKSLDNLDMLVHDLLTLSNIEIGQTKMQFEYFAINGLVNDVVEQFLNKAEKKNILIEVVNGSDSAIVFADWLRIKQVLNNLISNAIKYTNEGGKVVVALNQDKDTVAVKVKDNGMGIPESDIDHVFERFYRVDKSRSREKGGTGLGLAIVKHIIEGHKSTIEVISEVGKGSVFAFELPKGKQ